MTEWQPIETAPKDGTVIIFKGNHTIAGACRWWSAEEIGKDEGEPAENFISSWFDSDDDISEVFPTHWSPLPKTAPNCPYCKDTGYEWSLDGRDGPCRHCSILSQTEQDPLTEVLELAAEDLKDEPEADCTYTD